MRTVCNIVGDCIGLGIVDHFDKKSRDIEKTGNPVGIENYGTIENENSEKESVMSDEENENIEIKENN